MSQDKINDLLTNSPYNTKVEPKTLKKMFRDFLNGSSVQALAQKYHLHTSTIAKVRDEFDWENKRRKTLERTYEILLEKIAQDEAKGVNTALEFLEELLRRGYGQLLQNKMEITAKGVMEAIATINLLKGKPTERTEIIERLKGCIESSTTSKVENNSTKPSEPLVESDKSDPNSK